jgi:hypothetical protein
MPLTLNPVPLTLAAEIVMLVRPLLVSVSGICLLLPSCTVLKLREEELARRLDGKYQLVRGWAVTVWLQKNIPAATSDRKRTLPENRGRFLMALVLRKISNE